MSKGISLIFVHPYTWPNRGLTPVIFIIIDKDNCPYAYMNLIFFKLRIFKLNFNKSHTKRDKKILIIIIIIKRKSAVLSNGSYHFCPLPFYGVLSLSLHRIHWHFCLRMTFFFYFYSMIKRHDTNRVGYSIDFCRWS